MAGVGSHSAFSSLRPLRHVSAPGKKMQKLGLVMICIPEPTGVTCAVGAPLVLAGRYVERKYNSATVHDIGQETTKTIATIRNFKSNIM